MATYLICNCLVLLAVGLVAYRYRRKYATKPLFVALGVLLVLTLVFDNLIILSGIVAYDSSLISGLLLYRAPIEDFAYSIAAVLVVPLLWEVFGRE